ncbi:MAG: class I SAM-dependent methyltransferase [Dissulfurimicrobium sp.]|uniref:class I SAM-dependent methyltransferase n=1 Tax=Dissulfurimicrobium sp. TaxID=2022436 RepID=UPI00404AC2B5
MWQRSHAAKNVVAVDAYPELLAHALKRCENATLIQAHIGDLPLVDAQFNIVLALDVLEHIEPDLLLFSEARRVSRPGRRIINFFFIRSFG